MTATATAITLELTEAEAELVVEAIGDYLPYCADMTTALGEHGGQWAQRVDTYLTLKDRLTARLDGLVAARGGDPR